MWCDAYFFLSFCKMFLFFLEIFFFKNNMLLLPLFIFYFFTREHLKLYWNNNTLFHPVRVAMWGGKYNFFICTLAHRRKIYIFPMLLDTGLVYSRKNIIWKRANEWVSEREENTQRQWKKIIVRGKETNYIENGVVKEEEEGSFYIHAHEYIKLCMHTEREPFFHAYTRL